ncbi:hypothetical protein RclHR1_06250015 [Rhizophagus clarus]|uniref:Uncharacterized protein n=1 Tax=Rhizophagus clarus TaxID=94130 RepID=A0A2Z6RX82_9GLOM|nr:hypothetical protein RclHR1_06250015 [Rhizophagus clarus]
MARGVHLWRYDCIDKLESFICEQVGSVYKNEYALAYKSYSESGAGTILSNEEAFNEFLKGYQSITTGNKKVVVIVTLKKASKKQSHQELIRQYRRSIEESKMRLKKGFYIVRTFLYKDDFF